MSIPVTSDPVGVPPESRNVFNGADVNTSRVHCGNSDHDELVPDNYVNVIVAVFFDGTLNNRANTQARVNATNDYIPDVVSHENDESNVSRMEPFYDKIEEEKLIQVSVYIEGIGTENTEEDYMVGGAAAGVGDTGIYKKISKGCKEAVDQIKAAIGSNKINRLHVDTYGFSRGAAAARSFVHEITKRERGGIPLYGNTRTSIIPANGELGKHLAESNIEMRLPLCVRFVGLYDTVASYGYIAHWNDSFQLGLRAISKAQHTFQLAADDEHRTNFRLTNINSAGNKGTERFLPGAHSDIGGGYVDGADEEVIIEQNDLSNIGWFGLEEKRQKLIDDGWYTESEIEVNTHWLALGSLSSIVGKREDMCNRYSYIPLQIMAEFCEEKKVAVLVDDLKGDYPIISNLTAVKAVLDEYIKDKNKKVTINSHPQLIKNLRNKYLHYSSNYKNAAVVFEPNKPTGDHIRVIQNG